MTELSQSTAPVTLTAHQNDIAALAINQQGTLVATASVKVCRLVFPYNAKFSIYRGK